MTPEHSFDFRKGLVSGLTVGLILGIPAGVALKATGYDSDQLYGWMGLLGVSYGIAMLVAASLVAIRRGALAAGLAIGSTFGTWLAPLLVVMDIVLHSA